VGTKAASETLGISHRTVKDICLKGKIRAFKEGHHWQTPEDEAYPHKRRCERRNRNRLLSSADIAQALNKTRSQIYGMTIRGIFDGYAETRSTNLRMTRKNMERFAKEKLPAQ